MPAAASGGPGQPERPKHAAILAMKGCAIRDERERQIPRRRPWTNP